MLEIKTHLSTLWRRRPESHVFLCKWAMWGLPVGWQGKLASSVLWVWELHHWSSNQGEVERPEILLKGFVNVYLDLKLSELQLQHSLFVASLCFKGNAPTCLTRRGQVCPPGTKAWHASSHVCGVAFPTPVRIENRDSKAILSDSQNPSVR